MKPDGLHNVGSLAVRHPRYMPMKMTILLIGTFIPILLTGCNKVQSSRGITTAEAAKIQSVALASITATYSNLNSTDLAFDSMTNVMTTGGAAMIEVRYVLPATAETNRNETQNRKRTTTQTRAFRVILSSSGEVQSVSEGNLATVRTVTK